jgi:hypothetical protein
MAVHRITDAQVETDDQTGEVVKVHVWVLDKGKVEIDGLQGINLYFVEPEPSIEMGE